VPEREGFTLINPQITIVCRDRLGKSYSTKKMWDFTSMKPESFRTALQLWLPSSPSVSYAGQPITPQL
jgi:hypothetical protein